MEKQEIRKEIVLLINSIKEHADDIKDHKHIPQLELESILHKIEKLYQKSIVLNYLNSQEREIEKQKNTEEIVEEISNIEVTLEVEKLDESTREKTSIVSEMQIQKSIEVMEENPVDLFGNSIVESIEKPRQEKKDEKTPTKRTNKLPITDMISAIGINHKFQYVNNLFDRSEEEYSVAIKQLNNSESLISAMEYFLSLQNLYKWDLENEIVKRLLDLVERRYVS